MTTHLVLAGGGHSHALLLHRWAMRPDLRPQGLITLVSRHSTALYSGMVPALIAGAAIDVFSKEPAKENILFNNPKAILSPHIAASTTEASIVVAEMVANQLSDFLLKGVKINTV